MQGRTSEPSKSQARCKDFPDGWLGLGEGRGGEKNRQTQRAWLEGGKEEKMTERDLFPPQRSKWLGSHCNGRPTKKII